MKIKSIIKLVLSCALLVSLYACGGGGGGGTPPPGDTPPASSGCVWGTSSWNNCNWQ